MTTDRQEIANQSTGQDTRSVGEIVGDMSRDLSTLMHQEIDLAKTEMKQEVAKAGKGAGMFGGAGVAGLMTLFFLSFALTYLLDNWMPTELAALITAVLWGIAAAVLALRGRREVQNAQLQLPKTQTTLKEDVQWAKAQKS
jgi:F0F1-type ATP synthase assembly protein I